MMYFVTILTLKDWFILLGLGMFIIWFIWRKLKQIISKDTSENQ